MDCRLDLTGQTMSLQKKLLDLTGPAAKEPIEVAIAQGGPAEENDPNMHLRRQVQQRFEHLLELRMDILEIRLERTFRLAQGQIDTIADHVLRMEPLMKNMGPKKRKRRKVTKKKKGPPSCPRLELNQGPDGPATLASPSLASLASPQGPDAQGERRVKRRHTH